MTQLRIEVPGRAYTAELPAGPLRVGGGETCELRLSCEGVSALHCSIDPLPDGRHRLKDLQSGRPTLVNGIAVQQVALQPNDVIEVGEARLVYEPAGVAAPPPPAASQAPLARPAAAPRVEREPVRSGSHRRLAVLAGTIGGAGALIAVLAIVLGGSRGGAARVARDLEDAERLARAGETESARQAFERVAANPDAGEGRLTAQRWIQRLAEADSDAKEELDRIAGEWQDFDLGGVDTRRSILVQRHGAGFGPRFDAAVVQVRTRQDAWAAQRIAESRTAADGALAAGRFADALTAWTRLRGTSVRADVRAAAAEGMASVESAAKTAASALLETADRLAREGKPAPAAALREAMPRFAGTAAEALLLARARDLEAAAVRATPVVSPSAPPSAPKPEAPAPKDAEKATAALRDAEAAAKDLRFAVAVATLDAAGATSLVAGPTRDRLALRRRELDLARAGLDALAADIRANLVRYDGVVVAGTQAVSLLDADADGVTASVAGGRAKHKWAAMGAERIAGVASRWRGDAATTLAMASFLHEVGARDAFEATAARLPEGSPEAQALFPLLARWRGDAATPAGGYVLHEGRWRTPSERDAMVLEGKIREAALRLEAKDAAARKKAVDDLLALGPAARPALLGALTARRERVQRAISSDKVFTQPKTRLKVFEELEKRRREALALIQDAARYPYPSATHQGQEQVDALVDRVRQAWDSGFDLVAEWDKGVQEGLTAITEVDEAIARAQPGYRPDLEALREAASLALDMPSFAPPSHAATREYSQKVLAYNLKVPTTATPEERDDVLAVNEYRIMMGRRALKIEERLVRTARGHSRWMREHDVFAHDVDDPERRSPGLRAKRQGYPGGVGENIARGTSTGREAFDAWAHSSGHHRNMLAEGWTEMGAGRSGELWWTQNFGAASQLSLADPEPWPAASGETAPEPETTLTPRTPGAPQLPDDAPPGLPPPPPEDPKPPTGG